MSNPTADSPLGPVSLPGSCSQPAAAKPAADQARAPQATAPPKATAPKPMPAQSVAAKPAPAPAQPVDDTAVPASEPTSDAGVWPAFFRQWPEGIPQRGIVVNQLNEQIPFKGYLLRDDVVLLERTNPDSLGARFLLVPFGEIAMLKLIDPLKQEVFDKAGFQGKLPG